MPANEGGMPHAALARRRRPGAWHSAKAQVHHNNSGCASGRLIGARNLRPGDGGKPLCEQCQMLNHSGSGG
jgi:hypothetical protein